MPYSNPSEEKYPLLLLFVEDGKGGKAQRRVFIEKNNRSSGIASGATAVITQWPGHLTSCWVTLLFCLLTIFLIGMMVFAASIRPNHIMRSKCVGNHVNDDNRLDNTTIHLAHSPEIWYPSQLHVVEEIVHKYPDCKVHLILLDDSKNKVMLRKLQRMTTSDSRNDNNNYRRIKRAPPKNQNIRKKRTFSTDMKKVNVDIRTETKKFLKMLLRQQSNNNQTTLPPLDSTEDSDEEADDIEDLLEKHPKIILSRITYEEVFENSPLHFTWHNLNKKTLLFAVRVSYLWQYGGISFDLPENVDVLETPTKNASTFKYNTLKILGKRVESASSKHSSNEVDKVISFIKLALPTFRNIPAGVVTIDQDGLHMETRTSCHAFFGELLVTLRKANDHSKVTDVVKATLKMFCNRGAVDSSYCNSIRK